MRGCYFSVTQLAKETSGMSEQYVPSVPSHSFKSLGTRVLCSELKGGCLA